MALQLVKTMVELPHKNAIPEDKVVHTFHWRLEANNQAAALTAIVSRLTTFYTAVQAPGTAALRTFLGGTVDQPNCRIKSYRMDEAKPRTPVQDVAFNMGAATTTSLPREVAACLSYQGAKVSGVAQRNRRGRLYFGPLATIATTTSATDDARLDSTLRNALAGAATALAGANSLDLEWVVYSPTTDATTVVTDGWVDDAVDIVRSRGRASSNRTLWT